MMDEDTFDEMYKEIIDELTFYNYKKTLEALVETLSDQEEVYESL